MTQALDKLEQAIAAAGGVNAGQWADVLTPFLVSGGIVTPRRIASFVGQMSVESAGFAILEENLHYSAARLRQVWPSHFPDDDIAARYAMQPARIANRAYANRMGNGNEASGDGWLFRGSGLVQLTGYSAHRAFGASVGRGAGEVAAYIRTPPGAACSAVWFWNQHGLNTDAEGWRLTATTVLVNGGVNGLEERILRSNKALAALNA